MGTPSISVVFLLIFHPVRDRSDDRVRDGRITADLVGAGEKQEVEER